MKGVSAAASKGWIFGSLYQSGYTVSVSHIETVKIKCYLLLFFISIVEAKSYGAVCWVFWGGGFLGGFLCCGFVFLPRVTVVGQKS